MRIFIAGGSGVVGRRVVPALVAHGHHVTAAVRSSASAEAVRGMGAETVEVDLFRFDPLAAAVSGHAVVINLATSIPPFSRAARSKAWQTNDRIRTTGSQNLVRAAIAADVERYVQESIAFLYADGGSAWIHEDHPVRPTSITASALVAEAHARRVVETGAVAVVLRFATFYGPDSGHTLAAVRLARLGLATTPGAPDGYLSAIATDDAATAVLAAASTAPSGTYNVVDDEPVTRRDFDQILAGAVGRARLRPMPGLVLRLTGDKLAHVARSQRISNDALRTATGWALRHRSVREGLPAVVAATRRGSRTRAHRAHSDQG